MLNFSRIPNSSLLGKALRMPLAAIPASAHVRILQGPLRGMKWVAGSSHHGCWLGSYEALKQRKIAEAVRPGMVCYDIGAHAGFYTLLFSALAGPRGPVAAFEPHLPNYNALRHHVAINKCRNVRVEQLAIASFDGVGSFAEGLSTTTGGLAAHGNLFVSCRTLDSWAADRAFAPADVIKVDVEGAEGEVLRGAELTIGRHKPLIFVATHSPEANRDCRMLLLRHGYTVTGISGEPAAESDELVAFAP